MSDFGRKLRRPSPSPSVRIGPAAASARAPAGSWVRPRLSLTIQRSPLSDSVEKAWSADPTIEALLARLSEADVQSAQNDADVDAALAKILARRADDLFLAQKVRQGKLGDTAKARPVEAVYFRGVTSQRALVIAGVHGSEPQGIEVARLLIDDLKKAQPHYTVIVVPSLFPDNAATKAREGKTPTNRNFPPFNEDLAAATAAGGGTPVDASTSKGKRERAILPENVMLLELLERFRPERIISIHGTWRAGAAGVFYDPRSLRDDEVKAARAWAAGNAYMRVPPDEQAMPEGRERMKEIEEQLFFQRLAELRQQASDKDRDLSSAAASLIDTDTATISDREKRSFANREDDPKKVPASQVKARKAHPSVAGNVGKTGLLDRFSWSGSGSGGISLGEYAPPRGMSVFTVEPPINFDSSEYPTKKDAISAAERKVELQAYADAVRTVLLGK